MKFVFFVSFVYLVSGFCLAGEQISPVGRWKTFDEETGKPKSIVRIADNRGVLEGRIEDLLDPEDLVDAVCELCTGVRHKQKIIGLHVLSNLHQASGNPVKWEGGEILDPENGKTYRASLMLSSDGRRLDVRGYIGTPLLGRTQTWQRVD